MQLKRIALGVLIIFGCLVPASLRAQDPMMQQLPIDPAVRMGGMEGTRMEWNGLEWNAM